MIVGAIPFPISIYFYFLILTRIQAQRDYTEVEIYERLCFPVMNEGFKILEEGFAVRPSDIDVVLVHGYNYPRVSGGPMHQADALGLANVLNALQNFQREVPGCAYFIPSKLLIDCVTANQSLAQFWAKNGASYGTKGSKL